MKTIRRFSNSKGEEARSMSFSNVDDAEKLYNFGVEHSKVEWAFAEIDKDKAGGRTAAHVGNNEGGHSWLATVYEKAYGSVAFHISHSHISTRPTIQISTTTKLQLEQYKLITYRI